ncbi:MAG: flagellar basal body rod C-terminal domain-containing protein [Bryobacteraceae bacterium]
MDIRQAGLDGLRRAEASFEKSAARVAQISTALTGVPHDYVDLSTEAVAMMESEHAFQANLKTIATADELTQSTLDILG